MVIVRDQPKDAPGTKFKRMTVERDGKTDLEVESTPFGDAVALSYSLDDVSLVEAMLTATIESVAEVGKESSAKKAGPA